MTQRHARAGRRLVLVLLLAGCSLGPDYKSPVLETPAAFRATSVSAAQAWPRADWWRGFNSPDLNTLIDQAEAGSFDIQAAIARVVQADAQIRISGSALLPSVNATGTASWSRGFTRRTTFTRGGYIESHSYSLEPSAAYELDFWGKLRATQQSAEASDLFSRFDQQTVALTTITAVANTWFQALALQDRIDVARRNVSDAEQILHAIQARLDAGTASLLDVSQQETLVAGLRAQIPGLQSQLVQSVNALAILIGRPPESITVRPGTLTTLSLPEIAPGLPSEVLARRPDVASAEADLIAANANIRVARANFFPDVTLSAAGGWQSTAITTLFGPGALLASASASVAQTIFDNGLKGGQYQQAQGRYDELLADYRKAVVQAFTDVDDAVDGYRLATEQEALEQTAVVTAQRAADIARAQLLAGTIDIVTALQVQTALYTDLDLLAQDRLARFLTLVSIYKALGGGWSKADTVPLPSTIFHGVL
ncbi:MAG TPA: efflux transporter outer membrane subunit [Acetobacteraceae bacterium]|jgi:NodT family efflux transporter outer membrane factor (OMF) lipoprotein